MTLWVIIFLIFGLIIGSFLNVVIFRIDELETIVNSRSRCLSCKKTLAWYDMVPFISFFLLRAKCRYCRKPISWQYPLVELFTGLLFAYLYLMFGLSLALAYYLVAFSMLVVVFVYDIKTMEVPENFVWLVFVMSALFGWYFGGFGIMSMISGGLIAGGFLALLAFASKEKWMGYGDIKIGLILGFLTGYPNAVFGLFFAFILGSIVGLIMVAKDRKELKAAIPFAPFLIISLLFTLTYGQVLIVWYLGLFMR